MSNLSKLRVLYLATDVYGGYGGVAAFSRNFVDALIADQRVDEVVCLPRIIPGPIEKIPAGVTFEAAAAGGRAAYLAVLTRLLVTQRFDLIVAAHVNLSPMSWLAAKINKAPWAICLHGVEAWPTSDSRQRAKLSAKADVVVAVSEVTKKRFLSWCPMDAARIIVIPNAIALADFTSPVGMAELAKRYEIVGKPVILTLGRLDSAERYKGFDEVIEALPALIARYPDLVYVIAGKGNDYQRLATKVASLGLARNVVFTGHVAEEEKAALYALADVFAMPSRGEGFGIVLLEAMASGVPTIASSADGGCEAVRQGELGAVVNPDDQDALVSAIVEALDKPKQVPTGLDYFSTDALAMRISGMIDRLLPAGA